MSAIGTAKARELSSLANSRGAATAQCRCSDALWHCRLAAARFGMFAASSGAPCHGTPQGSELWPVGFNGAITAGIRDRRNGVRGSVCSAAILSRSCPPWVKSGHQRTLRPCSLYPQKRTLIERLRMSGRPVSGRHASCIDQVASKTGISAFSKTCRVAPPKIICLNRLCV